MCLYLRIRRELMTFSQISGLAPIFRIVREYPRNKFELRAHQMARKLQTTSFTPHKNPS